MVNHRPISTLGGITLLDKPCLRAYSMRTTKLQRQPAPVRHCGFFMPIFSHDLGRVDRRKYNTSGEYRQPSVTVVETRRPHFGSFN